MTHHLSSYTTTPTHRCTEGFSQNTEGPKNERTTRLHNTIAGYLDKQKMKIEALSRAQSVTPKQINDIIGSQTHYRTSRKSQLINVLVHAKAKEVNADLPVGSCHSLAELRNRVANDPEIKSLTQDEKAAYIMALEEDCKKKVVSVQANNLAAAQDVLTTTDKIVKEDNFWEDVYEHPMADFLRQYEQWACTQNQNLNECDSLEAVRKQVWKLILWGLVSITGKKFIVMNYTNYETAIVEAYGVRLIGWPEGVKFISPSNIGTVVHKPRKKCSDAGVARKRKSKDIKEGKRGPCSASSSPKSAEFIDSSDKEEDE
ncbi:hypothetical protein CY34DRAFT_24772 [Suillus luteus UH-Slu-Lm8-n1]|uniref:Uncharacterized protein n=1 Tax=Suillus luteus UH-Slu-Lm8-n1 TaxID=930992 RepID=A0A0C9ZRX3_9AGAM|nr:hypothetical protein CY34DRAFT_24772 [Suillus luteus UH-Slu-Lm8-n1]